MKRDITQQLKETRAYKEINGSIFTFSNDSICDIRLIYGKTNDKL